MTLANNSSPTGQRLIVSEQTSSTHAGEGKEKDKQLQKNHYDVLQWLLPGSHRGNRSERPRVKGSPRGVL